MMDGFGVDLDQLLNELEENEGQDLPRTAVPPQSKQQPQQFLDTSDDVYSSIASPCVPVEGGGGVAQTPCPTEQAAIPQAPYDEPYAPPSDLDLAEADFAPSPPKPSFRKLNTTSSQDSTTSSHEGYFVAEDEVDGCALNRPGVYNSNNAYNRGYVHNDAQPNGLKQATSNKPELIQDTSDEDFRDMLDSEGYVSPSFFSSSPPGASDPPPVMSRPDVVPAIGVVQNLSAGILNAPCHDYGQIPPALQQASFNGSVPAVASAPPPPPNDNHNAQYESFNISNEQQRDNNVNNYPDLALSNSITNGINAHEGDAVRCYYGTCATPEQTPSRSEQETGNRETAENPLPDNAQVVLPVAGSSFQVLEDAPSDQSGSNEAYSSLETESISKPPVENDTLADNITTLQREQSVEIQEEKNMDIQSVPVTVPESNMSQTLAAGDSKLENLLAPSPPVDEGYVAMETNEKESAESAGLEAEQVVDCSEQDKTEASSVISEGQEITPAIANNPQEETSSLSSQSSTVPPATATSLDGLDRSPEGLDRSSEGIDRSSEPLARSSHALAVSSEAPTASYQTFTTSSEAPTASSQILTTSSEAPTASSQTLTTSSEAPTASSQTLTASPEAPTAPSQTLTSSEAPTASSQTLTMSSEAPTASSQTLTTSSEAPTVSSQTLTASPEAPTASSQVFPMPLEACPTYSEALAISSETPIISAPQAQATMPQTLDNLPVQNTDMVTSQQEAIQSDKDVSSDTCVEARPDQVHSSGTKTAEEQHVESPKDTVKPDFQAMTPDKLAEFKIDDYLSEIPTDEISRDVESEISRLEAEISMMKDELHVEGKEGEDESRTSPDGISQQDDSGKVSEVGFIAVSPSPKLRADGDSGEIQKDPESAATLSDTDSALELMAGEERRGSEGSVDKFLVPTAPPNVATPMEDAGFSKVPGFLPDLDAMQEEEEPVTPVQEKPIVPEPSKEVSKAPPPAPLSLQLPASQDIVRPKDSPSGPNSGRKSRPSSLLGLSMPEMPLPSPKQQAQTPDLNLDCLAVTDQPMESDSQSEQPMEQSEPKNEEAIQSARPRMSLNLPSPMSAGGAHSSPVVREVSPFAAPSPVSLTSRPQLASGIPFPSSIEAGGAVPQPQSPAIAQPAAAAAASASPLPSASSQPMFPPNAVVMPGGVGPVMRRPNSLELPPPGQQQANAGAEDEELSDDGGSEGPRSSQAPAPETSSGLPSQPICPRGPHQTTPPLSTSNPSLSITDLGKTAPTWIPDANAPNCMQCEVRFTFTRRRHHCRACGKVFCNACCNLRAKLHHINKEARVCSKCYQDLIRAQVYERMYQSNEAAAAGGATGGTASPPQPAPTPNPNNPAEYCSTVPPMQQVDPSTPPPVVMVPTGVLRKDGVSRRNPEAKSVMFSDGIRPGGDLTELDGPSTRSLPAQSSRRRQRRQTRNAESAARANAIAAAAAAANSQQQAGSEHGTPRHSSFIPTDTTLLPPLIVERGGKNEDTLDKSPDAKSIISQLNANEDFKVTFAVNKNLAVDVKIVELDCCVGSRCWVFTSCGMCTVGQDEVITVLECLPQEATFPRDILSHMQTLYEEATQGQRVTNMGHSLFAPSSTGGFLGSKDHTGFLYIRPSFQCLHKLPLPSSPYVFAILLQKWETPWVKVFPLRLMLRLGAEYRYYPCPLMSVRFRAPVYQEIGHTIINLLADLRNFQYGLSHIRGATVHMETGGRTVINMPRNRYNDVMKVISNSNEHVMSFGSNFSKEADSHLVCIQNEEGNYQTQAINIQNKPRNTTGASFVVLNGALKSSSGLRGKASIVEDGVMVQLTADALAELKQALRDMVDYNLPCGPNTSSTPPEEQVTLTWVDDDKDFNIGVCSPIDGFPLEGVQSVHIHNAATQDYMGSKRALRWTEVFFLANTDSNTQVEPVDTSRLAESLASACCMALNKQLDNLKDAKLTRIGLRVNISSENVGYQVGSAGEKLPAAYMTDLDNELIPAIHNAASQNNDAAVTLELIFHIIE